MKLMKTVVLMSLSSAFMVTSVMAQEPLLKPVEPVGNAPLLASKSYKQYRVDSSEIDSAQVSDRAAGRLIAGTKVVNTLSGEPGEVSGIVAVLINDQNIDALAQQFGLAVERRYDRLNLALLKAEAGTDMLQLRRDMMGVDGISGVDIEIVEQLRSTQ